MNSPEYPKIYLYKRIVKAKLFIDKNFAENIDVENISDEASFSKFHFIRLFKTIYGKTPHQYLKDVRIEKAKQLLKTTSSISETCYSIGFESLASFSALFKRTTGQTPSEYSKLHRENQIKITRKPLAHIPSCYAYQHGWLKKSNFKEMDKKAFLDIATV